MGVIIRYALPLLAGNLLQQAYNVTDTIVVGRFAGKEALAAVGSSFAVVLVAYSIIIGLCMGAGVVISRHYGAGDTERLQATVATTAAFLGIVAAALTVAAQFFVPALLSVYRMPPEIRPDAEAYLRILFAGLMFTCLYNAAAFLLRAVGNSHAPLLFLAISMLVNIALDLLFVLGFGMAARGVAIATVIAQAVSALCAAGYARKKLSFLREMSWRPRFDRDIFFPVARYSILTCLQQSIMNFGGLLVQGLINSFGVAAMAAFAACGKIDAFIHLPVQDFGGALMTYIAQNMGAQKQSRVREGVRFTVFAVLGYCILVSAVVLLLRGALLRIFIAPGETQVLAVGARYLSIVACFYVLIGMLAIFYGYFRGIGMPHVSLILSVVSLGTRVAIAYALAAATGSVDGVWWAIPLGWALADIAGLVIYRATRPKKSIAEYPAPEVSEKELEEF